MAPNEYPKTKLTIIHWGTPTLRRNYIYKVCPRSSFATSSFLSQIALSGWIQSSKTQSKISVGSWRALQGCDFAFLERWDALWPITKLNPFHRPRQRKKKLFLHVRIGGKRPLPRIVSEAVKITSPPISIYLNFHTPPSFLPADSCQRARAQGLWRPVWLLSSSLCAVLKSPS